MENKPQKPPFPLSSIGAISFFFGFPPALVLYGINWQRLGRSEKAKLPIILGIVAGVLLIILSLAGADLLKIIPLVNIAFIVFFYKMQKTQIVTYQEKIQKKLGGPFLPILMGILFLALILGSNILFSGISIPDYFQAVSISQTKEFKDYSYALDNEANLTLSKRIELIYPFYVQQKDKGRLGAEVAYNYALALLDAGKFEEGQKLIENLYSTYGSDSKYGPSITAVRNGISLWEDLPEYAAFQQAISELLNKGMPDKALPIIESFHKKFKDNTYLAGETYFNLAVTYAKLNRFDEAKQVATEGMQKFPAYPGWEQFKGFTWPQATSTQTKSGSK